MLLNAVILTVRKLACKAKLYGDETSYYYDIMDRLMNQVRPNEYHRALPSLSEPHLLPQVSKCERRYIEPIYISVGVSASWLPADLKQLVHTTEKDGHITPYLDGIGLHVCSSRKCINLSEDSEFLIKTFICGGCKKARYCSRECQATAWREGHGKECKATI